MSYYKTQQHAKLHVISNVDIGFTKVESYMLKCRLNASRVSVDISIHFPVLNVRLIAKTSAAFERALILAKEYH
jgi:hypothetical protein